MTAVTAKRELKRDPSVDIIKGIGIICVVAGHCYAPGRHFIYLYHMALFFIASGYCFNMKRAEDLHSVILYSLKKIKSMWGGYYVLWMTIFTLLHNLFLQLNFYTDNVKILDLTNGENIVTNYWCLQDIARSIVKALLFHGDVQLLAAFWFLPILMTISILYCIVEYALERLFRLGATTVIQTIISICFLGLGYYMHLRGVKLYGIDRVLSYYVLYHGGLTLKKFHVSEKERTDAIHICILAALLIVLLFANSLGSIDLNVNSYTNPVYLLIVSFAGWQFIYEISILIRKNRKAARIFIYIGQHTFIIFALHFLCFKIVNYLGVVFSGKPHYMVAAFPVLYRGSLWWICYMAVGIMVPLLFDKIWQTGKSAIKRN
ncbi:MAG: acyltransferase family protein [Lactimicrobium sp.]|jgi:fucose 4-O-acetylase-like acetyltransferase|uniref:acyltransferase family protein n=1 Tax=Lactimicrobium sp. TaxID=2563780 RepID=UPI002F35FBEA